MDTGPGIPQEMQARIFEPFVQASDGVKHAQGTGLGLPLSRSLVQAHGGDLWVESKVGEEVARLKQSGFDGAIAKPLNIEVFPDLIARISPP